MQKETILVIGATGTVGSELMRILKSEGHTVRGTTSKPVKPSENHLVQVDLSSGAGLEKAFAGVDRAFLLSPPGFANQFQILSSLINQTQKSKVKKVVLMSAMGASASDSTPFRQAEIQLENSGLEYNIIRPNWFLQNFNTFWIQGIKEQGKILVPAGNAKVSFIDARDISAVAAKLLTSSDHANQAFDLTGSISHTHDEVAQALSKVTGKIIKYQEIPPETLKQGLLAASLPGDYVEFLLMIFGFLREGYNSRIENSVNTVLGRSPLSLEDYAGDYCKYWLSDV
ncbi:MAG: SDR family oxidoreductase [Bdellovibrio sp.]